MNRDKDWLVYLLKCIDNSLYCGVTKDIESRLFKHNKGLASKYTRSRLPVELSAVRKDLTKKGAYRLEYQIKKLPADMKIEALKNVNFK
ncbi:MAG: GIY-YIG nuclease family protein [Desulfobacula sp.]|uniref:GIY-YIG nuclease family protein n=1 Tax=Desulfobacula sp. TaxID=2593537 RepID=UPI001D48FCF6|nr:GIY-YIG nuclease family protein [Desulfobacula sp.]MBT3486756.1 GIY-YIG nuclease family protein [Desulfobacula sp.]MBT3806376.1 GIY-YIG nuclease family protein [Desulfobacula sp.]MBT4023986.1 GIY-YIG nuclease family protein [Desulfobacula sp.]MBT4198348.1 GIY-YIG nuclease family protein [Desulfobacula sp.]